MIEPSWDAQALKEPEPQVRGLTEREIGQMQEWMKSVDSKLECLLGAWMGNGKPGVKQDITELRHRLDDLEKWQAEVVSLVNRIAVPLVLALMLFLGGIAWGLLTNKVEIIFH